MMNYPNPSYACSVWQNPVTGHFHVCTPPRPGNDKGEHHVLRTAAEVGEIIAFVAAGAIEATRPGALVGRVAGRGEAIEFDLLGGQYSHLRKADRTTAELVRIAGAALRSGAKVTRCPAAKRAEPAKLPRPKFTLEDLGF